MPRRCVGPLTAVVPSSPFHTVSLSRSSCQSATARSQRPKSRARAPTSSPMARVERRDRRLRERAAHVVGVKTVTVVGVEVQRCARPIERRHDQARLRAELVRGADAALGAQPGRVDGRRSSTANDSRSARAADVDAQPARRRDLLVHVRADEASRARRCCGRRSTCWRCTVFHSSSWMSSLRTSPPMVVSNDTPSELGGRRDS